MKTGSFVVVLLLLLAATVSTEACLTSSAWADEAQGLAELKELLEAQRRLLEQQQRQLTEQNRQLQALTARLQALEDEPRAGASPAQPARMPPPPPAIAVPSGPALAPAPAHGRAPPRASSAAATSQPSARSVSRSSVASEDLRQAAATAATVGSSTRPTEGGVPRLSAVSEADKYDRDSPAPSNVDYYDVTQVINIPGTRTSIGLHGFVEAQMFYDTVGINNNRFDTITIPVDGGPGQTKFSVNPTQLAISSTTPVSCYRINTMISMDFNGQLDQPEPRLRIAYGEIVGPNVGFLGGQAYSTMMDLRTVPETLDFAGPAGLWQLRQPVFRVTTLLGPNLLAEAALETPENAVYDPGGTTKLTRVPDVTVAGTWRARGRYVKHVRLAALVRDLRAQGASGAIDSAVGWAIGGSTKVDLPFLHPKDNFKLNVHYGDGFGTYLKGGPREAIFDDATGTLHPIGALAFYCGLQHFWCERWRTNVTYGQVRAYNPSLVPEDAFKSTNYFAVNLIWQPFESVTTGFEYLWGRRENEDGNAGASQRFLVSFKYKF